MYRSGNWVRILRFGHHLPPTIDMHFQVVGVDRGFLVFAPPAELPEQFEHAQKATPSKLQIPRRWQQSLLAFLQSFHCYRSRDSMPIRGDYRRPQNWTLARIETLRSIPSSNFLPLWAWHFS